MELDERQRGHTLSGPGEQIESQRGTPEVCRTSWEIVP